MNKFEQIRSLELLETIQQSSIDLVLTDPPYIISRKSGFSNHKNGVDRLAIYNTEFGSWDTTFSLEDLNQNLSEFYRVLKNGGTCIVFCDLWKISYVSEAMKTIGFKQIRFVEWVKKNPVPINSKINYLSNAREVAILGIKKSKPTFHSSYDNGIYSYPICHEKGRFHPTQKPLAFMEELICKHSNEEDVVLDTFAGSGTTLVAAKKTNRHFIGCEVDERYFTRAKERLENTEIVVKKEADCLVCECTPCDCNDQPHDISGTTTK